MQKPTQRFAGVTLYQIPADSHDIALDVLRYCGLIVSGITVLVGAPSAKLQWTTTMLYSSTFYKRPLPSPPAVSFSSAAGVLHFVPESRSSQPGQPVMRLLCPAGKELFAEAMLQGTMEGFFKLIEQFRYKVP